MNKFTAVFLSALLVPMSLQANQETYIDQIAVMQAQIQLLEKQIELNAALEKSVGKTTIKLPKVLSIVTDANGSIANLFYDTGRVRTIKEGDQINPGVRVRSISNMGVLAETRSGPMMLAFHNPFIQNTDDMANTINANKDIKPPRVNLPELPPPVLRNIPEPPPLDPQPQG